VSSFKPLRFKQKYQEVRQATSRRLNKYGGSRQAVFLLPNPNRTAGIAGARFETRLRNIFYPDIIMKNIFQEGILIKWQKKTDRDKKF
jgi:hypothetical protein